MGLTNFILECEKDNEQLRNDINYCKNFNKRLQKENQELKKQLEYLRGSEYLNQLRFERDMLQNVVDNGEVSKEDKQFIDMTHRNTELLEQQKEFIEYMNKTIEELECDDVDDEEMKGYLIQRINTFKEILSKFKKIIGSDINVGSKGNKE